MRPERVQRVEEVLNETRSGSIVRPERVKRGKGVLNETRSGSIAPKFREEEIKITSLIKGWSQE